MGAEATLTHRGSLGIAAQWEARQALRRLVPHSLSRRLPGGLSEPLRGREMPLSEGPPSNFLWPMLDLSDDLFLRVG